MAGFSKAHRWVGDEAAAAAALPKKTLRLSDVLSPPPASGSGERFWGGGKYGVMVSPPNNSDTDAILNAITDDKHGILSSPPTSPRRLPHNGIESPSAAAARHFRRSFVKSSGGGGRWPGPLHGAWAGGVDDDGSQKGALGDFEADAFDTEYQTHHVLRIPSTSPVQRPASATIANSPYSTVVTSPYATARLGGGGGNGGDIGVGNSSGGGNGSGGNGGNSGNGNGASSPQRPATAGASSSTTYDCRNQSWSAGRAW
jgi:hypothetical protein